jgi:hypothetical protein
MSKRVLFLLLVPILAGACAAHPPSSSVTPLPAPVAALAPPPPTLPAYRARVITTVGGQAEAWTDVVVPGTNSASQHACETVLAGQVPNDFLADVQSQISRACSRDPLPPPPGAGGYVLVEREEPEWVASSSDLVQAMRGQAGASEAPDPSLEVTRHRRFPSEAHCETSRLHMLTRRQQERAASEATTKSWVGDQYANLDRERDDACRRQRDDEARCAAVHAARPLDPKHACKRDPESDRCQDAQSYVFDLQTCERVHVDRKRRANERECERLKKLVETVRAHSPEPPPPEPTLPLLECRPG